MSWCLFMFTRVFTLVLLMASNDCAWPARCARKYFSVKEVINEFNADSDSDFEASSDGSESNSQHSNVESESDSDRENHDTINISHKESSVYDSY